MCLLINQTANAPLLPDHWLKDFYSYNSDGAGVMYVERGELKVYKTLPKDGDDFVKFYRDHAEGRDCAIHLRFKTHGAINLENTHPYEVFDDSHPDGALWLMHNGVLSTGNAADTTKSDTWHYVRTYIRPLLDKNRSLLFNPAFQAMLAAHIGGRNKFSLLDQATGQIVTINRDAGVEWGGRWLSNTYAWSSTQGNIGRRDGYTEEELIEMELQLVPVENRGLYGDPLSHSSLAAYTPSKYAKSSKTLGNDWDASYDSHYEGWVSISDKGDSREAWASTLDIAKEYVDYISELGFFTIYSNVTTTDLLEFIDVNGEEVLNHIIYQVDMGELTETTAVYYLLNPDVAADIYDLTEDGEVVEWTYEDEWADDWNDGYDPNNANANTLK